MDRSLHTKFFLVFGMILFLSPFQIGFGQSNSIIIEDFDVRYSIEGGQITNIILDKIFVELIIEFESNKNGFLEISIPRGLMDSKLDNQEDDIFFVLVEGFETEYIETTSNSTLRTIAIPFFKGDGQMEIIGTEVLSDITGSETTIPDWIKNTAGWWAQGLIADSEFVSGIQYLITKGIMVIPYSPPNDSTEEKIPNWIKNTAGWWAQGLIADSEFVSGIQYLITKGIMVIQ